MEGDGTNWEEEVKNTPGFKRSGKREQSRRVWLWLATIFATICSWGVRTQKNTKKQTNNKMAPTFCFLIFTFSK